MAFGFQLLGGCVAVTHSALAFVPEPMIQSCELRAPLCHGFAGPPAPGTELQFAIKGRRLKVWGDCFKPWALSRDEDGMIDLGVELPADTSVRPWALLGREGDSVELVMPM